MTFFSRNTVFAALFGSVAVTAPLSAVYAGDRADDSGQRIKVVELFTSQGCNSCPPADALLGEIAKRPDVLALSFHVDYWDYIGWKDTFALRQSSERQRTYARLMRWQYVYTPQLVINGQTEVVGSRAGKIADKIAETPAADQVRMSVRSGGSGDAEVTLQPAKLKRPAWIWLVRYSPQERVDIRRGENSGKLLTYHNVVRKVERLAVWRGVEPGKLTVPSHDSSLPDGARTALIVQTEGFGKILAAGVLPPADR